MQRFVVACILFFGTFFIFADAAHATFNCNTAPQLETMQSMLARQSDPSLSPVYIDPNPSGFSPGDSYYDESLFSIFTNPLVSCMEDTIFGLGLSTFVDFRESMKGAVLATLTLFVIFFAIKAMFKAFTKDEAAEFFIHLLKFAGVAAFVVYGGVEVFMPAFFSGMSDLAGAIISTLPAPAVPACDSTRLWIRLDCNLAYILGADVGGASPQNPWTLFSVAGLTLFTAAGVMLMPMVGVLILLMMAACASAVLSYIMCVIALTILMMLSPLIIPMYLFEFTQAIFLGWLRMLFAYMLQPMVLFGYMAFVIYTIGFAINGDPATPPSDAVLGIRPIVVDIASSISDGGFDPHRPVVSYQNPIESGNDSARTANPGRSKGEDVDGGSFAVSNYEFSTSNPNVCMSVAGNDLLYSACRVHHLNINIFVLVILFLLLFSFMSKVIENAGSIVGARVSQGYMKSLNIYGHVVKGMENLTKDVTAFAMTGDVTFKNSASQLKDTVAREAMK